MKHLALTTFLLILLLPGCEKKTGPVAVGQMSEYRDAGYGFSIQYPAEWRQLGTTGKPVFVKSQEVLNRFLDPTSGEPGADVSVEVIRYEGKPLAQIVQAAKDDMKQSAMELSADQEVTAGGKQSPKVPYLIKATNKTNIYGYQIFVPGDTCVYKLEFKGYGDQFAAHEAVFDAVLKSFQIPAVVAQKPDVWQASANLETVSNSPVFSMQYPDNLAVASVPAKGKDYVLELRADRQDCSIHIDVFGAQKLTVDKVWAQNKGKYKSKGTGETTIDGATAYWVDYSPVKDISSRAYFAVKNDKVVRISLNWYTPQKDVYFPVFEKCVKSIKLK
ncbi:MAG TPA: PsbP-related protein [Bacteroidota bacterium]|jgi:hypothetical protein